MRGSNEGSNVGTPTPAAALTSAGRCVVDLSHCRCSDRRWIIWRSFVRPSLCLFHAVDSKRCILELEHEQEMPCQKSNPLVGVVVRPTDVAETTGCPVEDGCVIWRPFVRLSVCLSVCSMPSAQNDASWAVYGYYRTPTRNAMLEVDKR